MMIAVPVAAPLRKNDGNEGSKEEMESFFNGGGADDFSDFTAGDLLDAIDFDDLLLGINDEYVLPDLELDQQDLLSEFSTSCGEEYSDAAKLVEKFQEEDAQTTKDDDDKLSGSGSDLISSGGGRGDEIVNKAGKKEGHHKRKRSSSSSALDKNTNALKGKKKVKVDWTPELHKRFVQAVEQLGVDKAVPSRILEIMGIDCLTRHNIASHLQKYRSHRKHLLAREAEAANWTQRRQIYSPATAGGGGKMNINPWLAPTIGFPQMAPPSVQHNVRPFHVWGHPPVEQSPAHMWPKHLAHPPPLIAPPRPPMWAHPPPHTTPHIDSSYWYPPPGHHTVPGGFTQGTPCFQAPLATARFPAPHVPAVPTHPMYKAEPRMSVPAERSGSHSPLDLHPSSESIDAAIGDVLSKSWLPLPIGLKPPSLDSVMGELERQGVPKIPPTCAASDSSSIS